MASRLKFRSSYRVLPGWCLTVLNTRRVRLGAFEVPVFADTKGGSRDRNNVGRDFRYVRTGTDFDRVKPHTYRKTVAPARQQGRDGPDDRRPAGPLTDLVGSGRLYGPASGERRGC